VTRIATLPRNPICFVLMLTALLLNWALHRGRLTI
jgi:hypothetical protein